jgi:hypothetical protein
MISQMLLSSVLLKSAGPAENLHLFSIGQKVEVGMLLFHPMIERKTTRRVAFRCLDS